MAKKADKFLLAAMEKLEKLRRQECFDPASPDSLPTEAQRAVISDFGSTRIQLIRAGTQSGKSQTCSRLVTWVLTDTHPNWKRPPEWGSEPLLAIVAGRTGKQIEESLLPKIRSYLEAGTYKEVRIGNIIQRLELDNGNRIVFQSLENPNMARERIQSYVAHIAWIDELPPTVEVMDELLRRVQARNGYFLASFTPLVRNVQVQKFVDNLTEPLAKTYRFRMLDNPLYSDPIRQAEILSSLAHLPEHVRNSRLYGEWMSDDNAVFHFDYSTMVEMPPDYSPLWRHVESVDPAIKSALGYTLWAENPATGIWYCIKAEYIKGVYVPTELVATVLKLSTGYNIVRRISDPHESWYIHTAASMGISYVGVYDKNSRKSELIKNFQEGLGGNLRVAPTAERLIEEITSARWSDTREGKIVSGSDYHLCVGPDTAIWTEHGPRPITEVKVGDLVYTHKGRLRPVTAVIEMAPNAPTHEFHAYTREPLLITGNHPIWAAEVKRLVSKDLGMTGQLTPSGQYNWMSVDQVPSVLASVPTRWWPTCPTLEDTANRVFSVQDCFTWGYYLAEGSKSLSSGQLSFAGHQKEKNIFEFLKKHTFHGMTCSWRDTSMGGRSITISNVPMTKFAAKFSAGITKKLPEELLTISSEQAKWLVLGWIFGDGHLSPTGIRGSTISKVAAQQLQFLAHKAGWHMAIRFQKRAGRWRGLSKTGMISNDCWAIEVTEKSSMEILKVIDSIPEIATIYVDKLRRDTRLNKSGRKTSSVYQNGEYSIYRLKSNKQVDSLEKVYTLSVEEDNSYIANGIAVKNCDASQYFYDVRPKRETAPQVGMTWQGALYQSHLERKKKEGEKAMKLMKQAIARKGRSHVRRFS